MRGRRLGENIVAFFVPRGSVFVHGTEGLTTEKRRRWLDTLTNPIIQIIIEKL
jgi:hypothetical protein